MSNGSVVVAGAGLAGLSAAVRLAAAGEKVILLEASKKGGGRAYSFPCYFSGTTEEPSILDNGQHIMLGCYNETFKFLKLVGTFELLKIQNRMEVLMKDRQGNQFTLRSGNLPYPFDLLQALLGFNYLSLKQKLKAIFFILKLRLTGTGRLRNTTVSDWLKSSGQTEELFKGIWDILCTGALNSPADKASAGIFADILKVIFLQGSGNSRIVIPGSDLSAIFVDGAVNFIVARGGEARFSEPLESVQITGGVVSSVTTRQGKIESPDAVILAIPAYSLKRITGLEGIIPGVENFDMDYSSITSFHLRVKDFKLPSDFVALIDSPVQWVFEHDGYLSTVTSASSDWDSLKEEDIVALIKSELKTYLGLTESNILSHKMIKEKRATFICGGENLKHRPPTKTKIKNLFIAGDWTDTSLPATIEGAVKSGHKAADCVINQLKINERQASWAQSPTQPPPEH